MSGTRLKFKCWNCPRKYTLLRPLSEDLKLFVACPYCGKEAMVDLAPYKTTIDVLKSGAPAGETGAFELKLPKILPTAEPPAGEPEG